MGIDRAGIIELCKQGTIGEGAGEQVEFLSQLHQV
jgi:hypothetical protein